MKKHKINTEKEDTPFFKSENEYAKFDEMARKFRKMAENIEEKLTEDALKSYRKLF